MSDLAPIVVMLLLPLLLLWLVQALTMLLRWVASGVDCQVYDG